MSNSTVGGKVCSGRWSTRYSLVLNSEAHFLNAVTGTLKGYDQLMNLVLDNVKETTRGTLQRERRESPSNKSCLGSLSQLLLPNSC